MFCIIIGLYIIYLMFFFLATFFLTSDSGAGAAADPLHLFPFYYVLFPSLVFIFVTWVD